MSENAHVAHVKVQWPRPAAARGVGGQRRCIAAQVFPTSSASPPVPLLSTFAVFAAPLLLVVARLVQELSVSPSPPRLTLPAAAGYRGNRWMAGFRTRP